ncbi:hypothetical protein PLG01_01454 [Streptococcus mutans PKUSS-LG01]|nr:hypothetical protein PLG01_01454 [Streptococcus mutans PKUSS-LG01]
MILGELIFLPQSAARIQLRFEPKLSNLPSIRNITVSAIFITAESLV